MKKYPEPAAGAFILNPSREILLTKSHKWSNLYGAPGGHVEIGEKIEDALVREIKEETGLTIYDLKFLCFWEYINEGEYHKKKHMIFFNYLAHAYEGNVILNSEAETYKWVKLKDAVKLDLNKYTRLTIEQYILNN